MATTVAKYELTTEWRIAAPVSMVWPVIFAVEQWPQWWRGVCEVRKLESGDDDGVGAVYHQIWRGKLPYYVRFDVQTTRVEPGRMLEGRARGQLDGCGIWTFHAHGATTRLRYEWRVNVTRTWMRVLSPLARPVFAWNHDVIMDWGAQGLCRKLGVAVESTG